jgi:hypothetical protein
MWSISSVDERDSSSKSMADDMPAMEINRRDVARDRHLQKSGYQVLRFWNNQIDREFDGVLKVILRALEATHPTRLAPERRKPPSPSGEG